MLDNINKIILHLTLIDKVGPAAIDKILSTLSKETILELYNFSVKDLIQITQISENLAQKIILALRDKNRLSQELELIEKNKIKLLTIMDDQYPALLKNTHLPPAVLYIAGDVDILKSKSVAFVGSRGADGYGKAVINLLLPELIQANWTIVSGGAIGIDTFAHNATLENKGKTIAVLGAGLLKLYPASNKNLFEQIVQTSGAIVSPFPMLFEPLPGNFPARNRIISGLSRATIVVQAAEQSGASITARYALEQGREVGAVPGAINNLLSVGCHKLISQGAAVITSAIDIKALLNDVSGAYKEKPIANNCAVQMTISDSENTKKVINKNQTPQEEILYLATSAISFDDISEKLKIESQKLQEILFDMQLDGLIEQNYMGLWQRKFCSYF